MSLLRHFLFTCCVLLASYKFADGLTCYQCTSCNSPFKPDGITQVSSNDAKASCWKTTTRNVGTARGISTDCKAGDVAGVGKWCCNTNLCNGAISTTSSIFVISAIATVVFVMFI
ncbi:unnamed protein product [Adineta ricciae]|uniref:Uncharacterized protein n=1 Tax=Adineta ricciae TaxID=249248 RepID=A0A816DF68_ADIRI|nr:unnamed protein product [Adineta ricciae]CAF1636548.1 unnamed protein product [Adineta ricciae]